jgi:4-amino-4-deoxy-L-arabinose transferase-like glycosyltransferase
MTGLWSNIMAERQRPPLPAVIPDRTWLTWSVAISLFIALTRIIALRHTTLDLLPDEAQYWSWSRHFAFGYFSKPPVIAWLIAATTHLFGDQEWGVRLAAPLVHAGTGIAIGLLGRAMFNARVGFLACILYATLPGVTYSGLVISTDVPLLFFWAVALLAMWKLLAKPQWSWAVVLGLAFGLGMLSKYAMAYFLLGIGVVAATTPRAIWAASLRYFGLAAVIGLAVVAPNLAWNASHGWATFDHTAANANWGEGGLHADEVLLFAGAQFGVFGPILTVALIVRIAFWRKDPPVALERFLLAFTVPVLVLMILQSGVSRAHANWAAVSYVAGTLLVVGWLDRIERSLWLRISLILQVALFAAFTILFADPNAVKLGKTLNIFHQMQGWKSLSQIIERHLFTMPMDISVAADDREVMAELDYYLRPRSFPLVIATGKGPPGNQYELEDAVTDETGKHVLLIARTPDRHDVLDRFADHKLLEEWTIGAGQGRFRKYYIYELTGFQAP